jgi:adenylate cyclase class 2
VSTPEEREVKARVDDLEAVRARIEALGGALLREAAIEDDRLYDGEAHGLARKGCALRLRRSLPRDGTAPSGRLTWKGPQRVESGAKVREEIESAVEDVDSVEIVLERLGLRPAFRYQKERAYWRLGGATVALDRTALGSFVEIEGDADVIERLARELGLERSSFETRSYPELWGAAGRDGDMLL